MKASLKRRDGEEALLRAKIPLSVLGVPVCSGVTMGSSEELGLHISTLFTSGPSCRVTFMPNDSHEPFSFMVKAGVGCWGSPNGSSFVISAQVKFPATSHHPSFSFSIKPRLGDFSLCKSLKGIQLEKLSPSRIQNVDVSAKPVSVAELAKVFDKGEEENSKLNVANGLRNGVVNGFDDGWTSPESKKGVATPRFLKDWSLVSHNSLPLGQNVTARIRWRVGAPGDFVETLASDPQRFFTRLSLPVLSLDKISLHGTDPAREPGLKSNSGHNKLASKDTRLVSAEAAQWIEENEELNKVAAMCSSIRRQLHLVYSENQVLRSTMEEMKLNFNRRVSSGTPERSEMESSLGLSARQPAIGSGGPRKENIPVFPEERDKTKTPAPTPSQKKEEQVRKDSSSRKTPAATVDTSKVEKELKKAIAAGK